MEKKSAKQDSSVISTANSDIAPDNEQSSIINESSSVDILSSELDDDTFISLTVEEQQSSSSMLTEKCNIVSNTDMLIALIYLLFALTKTLKATINELETEIKELRNQQNKTLYERLLTSDKSCNFYTNIEKLSLF